MTANELKRLSRLSEWKERVAECRSSGLSVKAWCNEHGICTQTYYRWEKLIIAEASGKLQAQNDMSVVPIPTQSPPVFAELETVRSEKPLRNPETAVATIQYGNISIELYANADPSFIVSLCKELQHA